MGYIDKEHIEKLKHTCIAKYPLSYIDGILAFAKEIRDIPTADVVEVACKCENCRYFNKKTPVGGFCICGEVTGGSPRIRGNKDFCSYGERRTDNDL